MTRYSHWTVSFKFGSKVPLKNLTLSPKRTVTVLKWTEWLGLSEAGVKMLDGTEWSKQRAATGQGIMVMLACCEGIRKEKKGSLSARLQCLIAVRRFCRRRRDLCQPDISA
jgi:hypothetical protein